MIAHNCISLGAAEKCSQVHSKEHFSVHLAPPTLQPVGEQICTLLAAIQIFFDRLPFGEGEICLSFALTFGNWEIRIKDLQILKLMEKVGQSFVQNSVPKLAENIPKNSQSLSLSVHLRPRREKMSSFPLVARLFCHKLVQSPTFEAPAKLVNPLLLQTFGHFLTGQLFSTT